MATSSESFIAGVIWAALRQVDVFEVVAVEAPEEVDRHPRVVLRGRKTGKQIIVMVWEDEGDGE